MRPKSIRDVAEGHLCCGCGACAYLEPESITMVNITDRGLRPLVADGAVTAAATLEVCPGAGLSHDFDPSDSSLVAELVESWGPVLGVWEGFAADAGVRFAGSSGGAATALAAHCLEHEGFAGVVHIDAEPDRPYLNQTVFSTTEQELVAATGSRYAPASPCDRLDLIEHASSSCVFIGKPCDVAAAHAAGKIRPNLERNLGLTIGIFCAGTPSTRGTLEMMARMGFPDKGEVTEVRYRGNGWPGSARVTDNRGQSNAFTYDESWGQILQKHRQWRCYVCADHTGEFADVAVGDPWYHELDGTDPGRSLLVARTPRGLRMIESAVASGKLDAWPVEPDLLPKSQPGLEETRGSVWARIVVTRAFGVYAPRYRNMALFSIWLRKLSFGAKVSSVGGTAKRVFRKRLRHRDNISSAATAE